MSRIGSPVSKIDPEHRDVVVVGGGQAGLSVSYHLKNAGIDHVILERSEAAHEWRDSRWDNFTLVTPNWQCRLPGFPYRGPDPDGFMTRDETHSYVRSYARAIDAPVQEFTEVSALGHRPGGGFTMTINRAGEAAELTADQVVIATGGYHLPRIPDFAQRIPGNVMQLHSSDYRNSAQLPDGDVLVIGSGQSGAQIAEDLHLAGRRVHLAVGGAPRVARFYRGRDCVAWLQDMGHYDRPIEELPALAGGRAHREKTNHYVTGRDGGRDIDLRAFARDGMGLYGRLSDVRDDAFRFAPTLEQSLDAADSVSEGIKNAIDLHIAELGIDVPDEARYQPVWRPEVEPEQLEVSRIGSVIWAMGYRPDYRWVNLAAFDGSGTPRHQRGVTAVSGLYFLGLPWLHTWGSGRFASIARDAEYLASRIGEHAISDGGSAARHALVS